MSHKSELLKKYKCAQEVGIKTTQAHAANFFLFFFFFWWLFFAAGQWDRGRSLGLVEQVRSNSQNVATQNIKCAKMQP